jgi:exosortase
MKSPVAPTSRAAGAVDTAAVRTISSGQLLFAAGLLFVVLVAVYFKFFQTQVRWALVEPADWGHTLLVPAISGYFVWLRREELLAQPFKANWLGFPIVLLGIGAYIASAFGPSWFVVHHNAQGVSLGITLFGLILQLCGWRATKILLFPLCYFVVFGQSISDRLLQLVTERMQDWSAIGSFYALALIGIDVDRSGNVISIYVDGEPRQLNVAEACSGMRMLVAFLALGVAIAYTGLSRNWQRALLIAAGFPVALGVNVLRVFTLGILCLYDANFAAGDFHSFIGLVWLVPALFFYLGIMWFLSNLFVDESQKGADGLKHAASASGASTESKRGNDAH